MSLKDEQVGEREEPRSGKKDQLSNYNCALQITGTQLGALAMSEDNFVCHY